MSWIWRALLATLLVVGPAVVLPVVSTEAALAGPDAAAAGSLVRAVNDNDPEELCNSGNPRKQKKCRYNGWDNNNWNTNDNDDDAAVTNPSGTGGLYVDLWRSTETPTPHTPLMVAVKGDGAPIERVSWWATGPTADNPYGDDLAHLGEVGYDCGGSQPCAWSWTVMPRHAGYYAVHARVRDTSGREVETVWQFTAN